MELMVDNLTDRLNRVFLKLMLQYGKVLPGVPSLLHYFSQKGLPMAVATSTTMQAAEVLLAYYGLCHYFVEIRSSDEFQLGKPEPDIFIRTAMDLAGYQSPRPPCPWS